MNFGDCKINDANLVIGVKEGKAQNLFIVTGLLNYQKNQLKLLQ